jgi:hypothetical protein
MPTVSATFSSDNQSVTTVSTKSLSNVVVKYHDNTTQKFDNLSGLTRTFTGTGDNTGKCIIGVWIKSGCNSSNDGPGYGEWVPNNSYTGQCAYDEVNDEQEDDQPQTPQINKPVRTNPVPNRTINPRTPQPTQNENQVNPGTLRNNPNPRGGTNTGGGALQRPRP